MAEMGRPTTYLPEYCDTVVELGKAGKSHTQIACALGVARSTLYLWQETYPEFSDAMTRARELSQCWFEDKGQDGLEKPGFNASLWAKQVSCRFPDDYTDRSKSELTGAGGKDLFPQRIEIVAVKPEGT